jgi:hypothetical protein
LFRRRSIVCGIDLLKQRFGGTARKFGDEWMAAGSPAGRLSMREVREAGS